MTPRDVLDAVTPLVIWVAPVVNWLAAAVLGSAGRQRPWEAALVERALAAFLLALVSTAFAVLAVIYPEVAPVNEDLLHAIGAVVVAMLAIPGLVWLGWYWLRVRR
jgi:hypothetical protein